MKQKIVVKVSMHCDKCRSKAMKIAVSVSGVESAAITGQEKNQLEVVGDGIDSVELTRRLRKNVGHAELVSVGEATKPKPPPQNQPATTQPPPVTAPAPAPPYGIPQCNCCCEVVDQYFYDRPSPCTIL